MTVTIENTAVDTTLNIAELTTASLTGTGVFDVLLQTLRLHLDREFTSGRITGTAYATVYSQALTSFLGQATAYCLSKAKLALELKQMQEVIELTQLQQTKLIADTRQTDYITDSQLAAEVALKAKQLDLLAYDLTNIKPTELSIAQQEIELKTSQAGLAEYDLTVIKPQELALITQQVATQQYTLQTRMPAELASIQADTSLKVYELTDMKPSEKAQLVAQTSHVTKQELSTIQQTTNMVSQNLQIEQQTANLASQQNQIEAETGKVLYQVAYMLPEEVTVTKRNQDQLVAQTNKITTDTVISIKQGHLTDAQTCEVKARTNQVNAEVSLKLPEDVELIKRNQASVTAQAAQVTAQTSLLAYDLATTKPIETDNLTITGVNLTKQGGLLDSQIAVSDKQALSIEAETSKVVYETTTVLPEEVKVAQFNQDQILAQTTKVAVDTIVASKQGNLIDAQVCEVKAQANQVNATVALKLPEEVEAIKRTQGYTSAQTSLLAYDLTTTKPVETANLTKTGLNIAATTSNLEAEGLNIIKQGDLLDSQKVVTDKQALHTEAETDKLVYQTTYMMPEELAILELNQAQVTAQTAEIAYRTSTLMPSQVTNTTAQTANTTAQTSEVTYRVANLLPAQLAQTEAQTGQVTYTTTNLLPAQVTHTTAQTANTTAQTANTTAQTAQVTAQTSEVTYRVANLLPAQLAQTQAQTAQVAYTVDELLPAQLSNTIAQTSSTNAQTDLYEQKTITEAAQTTSTPVSGSVMGVQNALMVKQTQNYERDAEQKAARIMIDTWNVRRNQDPNLADTLVANRLQEQDIGIAVGALLSGLSA